MGGFEASYDNDFRVTTQTVNGANSASFSYDKDSLLTAAGGLTITRDTQNGRITGTTLGSVTTGQGYNSFGEMKSFHAVFASDTLFKTVYVQDSLGRITHLTETIQGETKEFNYVYDAAGRLSKIIDIDSLITTIERDTSGNRTAIVSPFGQRTIFTLDANGYLTSITNPNSETLQFTYTADGLMTSMTDCVRRMPKATVTDTPMTRWDC